MKRITSILFSSRTTIILLIIAGFAMGIATFIEDKYDTVTSKQLVYNTKWFEFLFLLLIINLIGHIKSYNLLRKEKLGGFVFHVAFIVMILGAGITRYFSYEGSMHIRKGETTNILYSDSPFLQVLYTENGKNFEYEVPVNYGYFSDKNFHISIPSQEKGTIDINYNNFIPNAIERIEENVSGGSDILVMNTATAKGQGVLQFTSGDVKKLGDYTIAFNNPESKGSIQITSQNGKLQIISPVQFILKGTTETQLDTLENDKQEEVKFNYVYNGPGLMFMCTKVYQSARKVLVSGKPEESEQNAFVLDISVKGVKSQVTVFGGPGFFSPLKDYTINDLTLKMAYGNKPIELPFSLKLNNFILERYAGSESPSSYASEVTLIDNRKNLKEDHRIFMNNVLDYDMFRFFQSSYDRDEQGTILSVNHDFWGTWISYLGYALLTLGFIITLFNKNSRFLWLRRNIVEVRNKRKALSIAFIIGLSSLGFSQGTGIKVIDVEHADSFGRLLSQSFDGRFQPVNSLVNDVLHKISRQDHFNIEGKGKMNAMQTFIDMVIEPEFWKNQEIIYVKEKSVKDVLGVTHKYASFNNFLDEKGQYKLQKYVEEAFRKKQSEQNKFDKEIIKVDERLNVLMMTMSGSILKIFPEQGSPNNKWISWDDKSANVPLSGALKIINEDLKLQNFSYAGIMQAYLTEVANGASTGNYSNAEKILSYLSRIQKQDINPDLLPSETKVNVEVFYNKADIFIFLRNLYGALSVVLLFLSFAESVRPKRSKLIGGALNILTVVLIAAFLYHTFGMILRWYLTGHAPWSNGYETLLLIGWGALLAGFTFAKQSKITLAATTLLAFFVLMTASHSNYDPQLTNLQPVLKSYWLIIHVATLTVSYGFLGLGFALGLINLCIYLFKNTKNYVRLNLLIKELTYINEMNLSIGIVLATIGTFLGGVWANESWGRYWGWDAKETWALVISIAYALVLHLRFVPKLKGLFLFNVSSVIAFGSVVMTFVGVNYYLSKGMHSYGAGDTPVFPLWAWAIILSVISLFVVSGIKEKSLNTKLGIKQDVE